MKIKTKRTLTLLLSFFMVMGILPFNVFAAVEKPNWEKPENTPIQQFWPLPEITSSTKVGVAQIGNAGWVGHAGDAGLTHAALNYENHYVNKDGRLIVKLGLSIDGSSVSSSAWDIVDLHFDPNLYEKISDESYAYSQFKKEKMVLTNGTGVANERTFKLQWGKTDIYLIMNPGVTWKEVKEAGETQDLLVQARLYYTDRSKVWSKSSRKTETDLDVAGFKNPSYSSYTLSTMIPTVSNIRGDLILKNDEKNSETQLGTTATRTQFMPDSNKLRVTISRTNQGFSSGGLWHNRHIGVRQYFTKAFYDMLDTTSEGGKFLKVYIRDHDFKVYKNDKPQSVNSNLINTIPSEKGEDFQGYYVQLVDANFKGLENEKKHAIPTADITMSILNYGETLNPVNLVFEYKLTNEAVKNILDNPALLSALTFNTEYMLDHVEPWTKYEWTITKEDVDTLGNGVEMEELGQEGYISIPEGDQALRVISGQDDYVLRSNKDLNVIIETEGSKLEYNWADLNVKYPSQGRSQFYVPTKDGLRLKAGDKITALFPFGELPEFANDFNGISFAWQDGTNQRVKRLSKDVRQQETKPNRFRNGQQMVGATIARTQFNPKVDEVFTDALQINGHLRYQNQDIKLNQVGLDEEKETNSSENATVVLIGDKKYEAYKFSYNDLEGLDLSKDASISFTNQLGEDMGSNEVNEQVQAKVTFDLNGGTLPTTVKSFEGFADNKIEDGDEVVQDFNYDTQRILEGDPVIRIAPLNKIFRGTEGYEESGFSGENITYKDHNGEDLQGEALALRKFVEEKPKAATEGQEFLGWTTKKIEGDATEAYENLEEAITVDQFKDSSKNYKFTANTPFDSSVKVYAAYGKPRVKVILHRDLDENDTVKHEIILTKEKFGDGDEYILEIPKMYYNKANEGEIEEFTNDGRLIDYLKENTFVGWAQDKDDSAFKAGALLENNGYQEEEVNNKTLALSNLAPNKLLPNTFKLKIDKSFDELREEGKNIELYAAYRPFYTVEVKKQFKNYAEGKYTAFTPEQNSLKHDVKFGLLYRTAVTNWNDPTVLAAAAYYTLNPANLKDTEILKEWKKDENNKLTWKVPGYDILGQRLSYIAVEIPIGQEARYDNHSSGSDWSALGINVYKRIPQDGGPAIQDPNAPNDPIRPLVKLSKSQTVEIEEGGKIDVFTAATSRAPKGIDTNTADENLTPEQIAGIQGYEIIATNVPIEVPDPIIKDIYEGDAKFTVNKLNSKIDKINITYNNNESGQEYTATFNKDETDTWTSATANGALNVAKDSEGNLIFTLTNPAYTFDKDDIIKAQNFIETAESNVTQQVVKEKLESNKVVDIKQTNTTDAGNPTIEFKVPKPLLDSPEKGTKYTIGSLDEGGNFTPIKEIELDGKNYLPGDTISVELPKDSAPHGTNIYVKSEEPDKKPADPTNDGTFGNVTIDLEGPSIESATLKDDKFRMFVDIKAQFSEVPYDSEVTVKFDYIDDEKDEEKTFETKTTALDYIRLLARELDENDMPKISIIVKDKFNNKAEKELTYKQTKTVKLSIITPYSGESTISVITEKGATIKIKVYNSGAEVASATAKAVEGTIEVALLKTGKLEKYELQEGDIIEIVAEQGEAISNPLVNIIF